MLSQPERPTVYAIDFGTSNSLVAAANGDRIFDPVPLDPAADDPTILRSILCFPDAGGVHVGSDALRQFIEQGGEARLLRSIKRHLGSRSFRGTIIRGRLVSAEELVAIMLRQMRVRADAHFGVEVRRALLGRPVHFDGDDDAFAEARLRKAALLAGFEEVELLPEPVAAARAFGAAAEREELALIGDFGGGTSDFTVLRVGPRTPQRGDVLAVGGVAVAGDALDASIMRAQVSKPFRGGGPVPDAVREERAAGCRRASSRTCAPRRTSRSCSAGTWPASWRTCGAGRSRSEDRRRMDQLTALVEDMQGFHLFEAIERGQERALDGRGGGGAVLAPGDRGAGAVTRAGFEEASRREVDQILRCLEETVRAAGVASEGDTRSCAAPAGPPGSRASPPSSGAGSPPRGWSSSRASTRWSKGWRARRRGG